MKQCSKLNGWGARGRILVVLALIVPALGLVSFAGSEAVVFQDDFDGALTWTVSDPSIFIKDGEFLCVGAGGSREDRADKQVSIDLIDQDVVLEARMKVVSGGLNYRLPHLRIYFEDGGLLATTYLPAPYGWQFGTWTGIVEPAVPGTGWWTTSTADYWTVVRIVLTSSGGELYMKPDDAAKGWHSESFTRVTSATWSHSSIEELSFGQPWSAICLIDYVRVTAMAHNEEPTADAGADVTVECTSTTGTSVALNGSGSSDPDGDTLAYEWSAAGITFDDATSATPRATFPLGPTLVTLTVTDGNGGLDLDDVLVTVEDTTAPLLVCTTDVNALWPPTHSMVPVDIVIVVAEDCSLPSSLVTDCTVRSSEPDDANGDGNFTGDVDGKDGYTSPVEVELTYDGAAGAYVGTVYLRAERDGSDEGRVYSIVCEVADVFGNAGSASCVVVVPHDKRKK